MFASCHFGSSIDTASANYKSSRHIASAMGKRAGQALVLKCPAAKMCSHPRATEPSRASRGRPRSQYTTIRWRSIDLGAAVAKLSALSLGQLRARATSLGVAHRDESKRQKRRNQLEEDCRLALEAQQYSRNQMRLYCARLCWRIRYCGCEPAGV